MIQTEILNTILAERGYWVMTAGRVFKVGEITHIQDPGCEDVPFIVTKETDFADWKAQLLLAIMLGATDYIEVPAKYFYRVTTD